MRKRDLKQRIRDLEDEVAALRAAPVLSPGYPFPLTIRTDSTTVAPPWCELCGAWHWPGSCNVVSGQTQITYTGTLRQ